jgi:maltase-glucoamylase
LIFIKYYRLLLLIFPGDNTSKWEHVKQSMIGAVEFSLFGFTYTGPDTCGFFEEATEELCMRWTQLGAFFVYSRNHNGLANRRQDPASWGPKFAGAARKGIFLIFEQNLLAPVF